MNDQNLFQEPDPREGPTSSTAGVLELPGREPSPEGAPEVSLAESSPAAYEPVKASSKARPGWLAPAAVGAIGVIAGGILGGLLYVNTGQRDLARKQLAATSATLSTTSSNLADTQARLSAAQSDAAAKAVVATYVATFVADDGRVQVDAESMYKGCADGNFGACRTSAQQAVTDLQAFQADRESAKAPNSLAASDGMLKDSISAAIAALQELISGLDNNKVEQVTDGSSKFDAAMLGIGKAQVALGAAVK